MNTQLKDDGHDSKMIGRRMFNRKDIILILSLLLVVLIWLAIRQTHLSSDNNVCYILYDREIVMTVELNKDRVFSLEHLPQVVFEVRSGRIAFIHSDCPDQVCVHTGFIGEHNQFAACLPNRVALRVQGENNNNAPDAIVQ